MGECEVIEVEVIGVEETRFNVVTFWTGGNGIRFLVMLFGVKALIGETC